jgi:hypothetical protein
MTTAAITLGSGKMPVFQERTSELLLKQAETLHNMARRAKRWAIAVSEESVRTRLLSQAKDLEERAAKLEREATER